MARSQRRRVRLGCVPGGLRWTDCHLEAGLARIERSVDHLGRVGPRSGRPERRPQRRREGGPPGCSRRRPLSSIQDRGGWTTAKILLDVYGPDPAGTEEHAELVVCHAMTSPLTRARSVSLPPESAGRNPAPNTAPWRVKPRARPVLHRAADQSHHVFLRRPHFAASGVATSSPSPIGPGYVIGDDGLVRRASDSSQSCGHAPEVRSATDGGRAGTRASPSRTRRHLAPEGSESGSGVFRRVRLRHEPPRRPCTVSLALVARAMHRALAPPAHFGGTPRSSRSRGCLPRGALCAPSRARVRGSRSSCNG